MVLVEKRIKTSGPDLVMQPCGKKVLNHPQRIELHYLYCIGCQDMMAREHNPCLTDADGCEFCGRIPDVFEVLGTWWLCHDCFKVHAR